MWISMYGADVVKIKTIMNYLFHGKFLISKDF